MSQYACVSGLLLTGFVENQQKVLQTQLQLGRHDSNCLIVKRVAAAAHGSALVVGAVGATLCSSEKHLSTCSELKTGVAHLVWSKSQIHIVSWLRPSAAAFPPLSRV